MRRRASDRDKPPLLVVALGGNALQRAGEDSVESDFTRTRETARHLVRLAAAGPWRLVVTHGNGPQVGNHLLRSELGHAHGGLPLLPLEVCVADTQGGMGFVIQQCLTNALHEEDVAVPVASVVTQVVVDRDDPAFAEPSKPVGGPLAEDNVEHLRSAGWSVARDGRGEWRRVVPSPDPKEIVEAGAIRSLVDEGVVVVAAGGGGIPVVQDDEGDLVGAYAVIDKDLASALLATDLRADGLLILTDVESVMLGYGTDEERAVESMTVTEARGYLDAGEFPAGSMGPKVEALCRFAEASGPDAIAAIASIEQGEAAAGGRAGTRIIPG